MPGAALVKLRPVSTPFIKPPGPGAALLLACALAPVALDAEPFEDIFDQTPEPPSTFEEYERKEGETVLPPYPEEADLQAFTVSGVGARRSYALDSRHLTVGADRITRYTLVVASAGGAKNVFHEGIDCLKKRYKTYAYGRRDGTFRERREPPWRPLVKTGARAFRYQLARHFLCDAFWSPRPPEEALERMRYEDSLPPDEAETWTY